MKTKHLFFSEKSYRKIIKKNLNGLTNIFMSQSWL